MYFPGEPHTTYAEAVAADATIESGLADAGYTEATVEAIRSWFGTRVICDEIYFKPYFLRLAAPYAEKYNAQVRLETVDKGFDPLIENYSEHYTEFGGYDTRTPAEQTTTTTPASTTKTITPASYTISESPAETTKTETVPGYTLIDSPAETTKTHTPVGYIDTFEGGTSTTRTGAIERGESGYYEDTTDADNDNKGLSKANPMSSSAATIGSGDASDEEILGLNWQYSSAQEQSTQKGHTKFRHDASGAPTTTETYESLKDTLSGRDVTTRAYSGAETTATETDRAGQKQMTAGAAGETTLEVDKAGEKSYVVDANGIETIAVTAPGEISVATDAAERKDYARTVKERYTGRAGLTPQKALAEAITYLRTVSPAFFDLMQKLEPAFLGVYDI